VKYRLSLGDKIRRACVLAAVALFHVLLGVAVLRWAPPMPKFPPMMVTSVTEEAPAPAVAHLAPPKTEAQKAGAEADAKCSTARTRADGTSGQPCPQDGTKPQQDASAVLPPAPPAAKGN